MLESILILFELYFPTIFYKSFNITPGFLLLLIIFIVFKYGRRKAILIAFLFGFIQDILIQHSWFGLMTLLISTFAFAIGYLVKINDINIKYILFALLLLVYFYFHYLIQFSAPFTIYLELSFIRTLTTIIAYFAINLISNKRYIFFEK